MATIQYLSDIREFRHAPSNTKAQQVALEIWVMAVDGQKRSIAARTGARLCYSGFHLRSKRNPSEIEAYFQEFVPGKLQQTPYATVAMSVACAESRDVARKIARIPRETPGAEPLFGTPLECVEQLIETAERFKVREIIVKLEGKRPEVRRDAFCLLMDAFNAHKK